MPCRAHDQKASFHEQKSMKYEDKADRAQDVRRKFRKAAIAGLVLAPVLLPVGAVVVAGAAAGAAGSAIKKKFHEKQAVSVIIIILDYCGFLHVSPYTRACCS
jgi:hypothetical protein